MPSPFPGMDPYLEEPGLWPDVHHCLISGIQCRLNQTLRPKYMARVEDRVYLSDENDPGRDFIIPDVRVLPRIGPDLGPSVYAGETSRAAENSVPAIEVTTQIDDEIHESFIKIIDRVDRSVVALIEVLSPTNKAAGASGRASYVEKRREVMGSPTHFIEIDLSRAGIPPFTREKLPPHDYLMHVSRAREDGRRRATVWAIPLTHRLPVIPIPLRNGDADAELDLQEVLAAAYEHGAYDLDIDYAADPVPPVKGDFADWVRATAGSGPTV